VPEPLLETEPLVVAWDPETETVRLTSFAPGPAGVSVIPFARAELEFDVAEFGQFSSLTLEGVGSPADLGLHDALLGVLFSPARIDELRAVLPASVDQLRRLQVVGPERRRFDRDPELEEDDVRARALWARCALALDQSGSPGLLAHERDLQLLESAVAADRLGVLQLVDGLAVAAAEALARLAAVSFGDLERVAAQTSGHVQGLLREALTRLAADPVPRLATALELLPPGFDVFAFVRDPRPSAVAAPPPRSEPSSPAEHAADVIQIVRRRVEDLHSLNVVTLAPDLSIRRTTGDEHVGTLADVGRRTDGWWLRAFAGDSAAPVAIAPFVQTPDGDAEAALVLPPSLIGVVHWDIVDDPAVRRLSPGMSSYVCAFAFGKAAARHERLGDVNAAIDLWWACSELHADGRDQTRSNQARRRAELAAQLEPPRRARGTQPTPVAAPALVTDHVMHRHRSTARPRRPPRPKRPRR
jgi:hypothetical protein